MDDYVRKSFDGYEEDPAPDMWDRVERDLSEERDRPACWIWLRSNRRQAVAAGVIFLLLGTIVCEHLYYQEKINALTQQSRIKANTPATPLVAPAAPEMVPAQKPSLPYPEAPGPAEAANTGAEPGTDKKNASVQSAIPGPNKDKKDPATPLVSSTNHEKRAFPESGPTVPSRLSVVCITPQPAVIPVTERAFTAPAQRIILPEPPVRPVRESSGWYAGLAINPLFTFEQGRMPAGRPGRPAFRNEGKKSDYTTPGWLVAGKKIGARWAIESGLGYQENVRTATHIPQFRFGDGQPGSNLRRSFQYDLSTYGGTAEVSLRMEQSTPGAPPSDDEPVRLEIETRHRTVLLRVPLLMAGEWGRGAWRTRLKAGVVANYFLENELDISTTLSNHPRLRVVDGQNGYTVQLAQQGKVFPGYLVAAGLEYRAGRSLGISLDLTTLGDFARKDAAGRKLPQHHAAGLNAGLNYYF